MKDFPGRCTYVTPSRRAATAALRLRRCLATLHLRHSFAPRCNSSAASSSVPRYAAPTSLLRAALQRQRCVFVGASLRCTYVTPSRRAATAALRLRRCLATLHLRHSFAPRCNGSAASSSVPRYAASTSLLRAALQRQRCVFIGASLRCTYVTPSRYAATAALRDVSRAATLQRSSARMDSYKRMDRRTVGRYGR